MAKIVCFDHYGSQYAFDESEYIPREAVYGISQKDSSILLVKDAKSQQWEIPGGGKEGNESDGDCLKREFFEETGIHIVDLKKKQTEYVSYFYDVESKQPWKTLRKYYIVTTDDTAPLAKGNHNDIAEAKFQLIGDVLNLPIQDKTRSILNALED